MKAVEPRQTLARSRWRRPLAGMVAVIAFAACTPRQGDLVEPLISLEGRRYRGEALTAERVRELEAQVARYAEEVHRLAEQRAELSVLHKMLGVEYMNRGMYGEAAASLEAAIAIDTENAVLFYLHAVASARAAKAQVDAGARDLGLQRAAWSYRRAVDLDPNYVDALYGLSVLLVFELDQSRDAEPLLARVLEIEERNVDAMFVRAAMYVRTGRPERAIEQYDRILEVSTSGDRRAQARRNRDALAGQRQ